MNEITLRLAAVSCFLWAAAQPDMKTRKIPVWMPAAFGAVVLAVNLMRPSFLAGQNLPAGALPGLILLLLSFLPGRAVGAGDGLCLLLGGLMTGWPYSLILAETALVLAAVTGLAGIWKGKRRANDRIAFIPYLAASSTVMTAAEVVRVVLQEKGAG